MHKKILLVILFAALLFAVGGTTVKRGPGSKSTGTALFMLLDDGPSPNECLPINTAGLATVCATHYVTNVPVNEPSLSSVAIENISCIYDDNLVVDAADELNLCVAYQLTDDSITNTSACIKMDNFGTLTSIVVSTTVPVVIPENAFGLLLRVISITDVNASWRGSCTVRWATGK